MLKDKRIAFVGAGAMGSALIRGVLSAGVCAADNLVAHDVAAGAVERLRDDCGIAAAADLSQAVKGADIVLLAVKPQVIDDVLQQLAPLLNTRQLVVSIAAGVSTSRIEAALRGIPVVRVMPNTPCLIGASASALAKGTRATDTHLALAREIFEAVGTAVELPESQIDAVTGLSGSGPAYVYVIIEALSDAGVRCGLARNVATALAAQTVLGAARMVLETGTHPAQLKDQVTSPGGTTIAALHELERHGIRGAIYDAVVAATERSRELSRPK